MRSSKTQTRIILAWSRLVLYCKNQLIVGANGGCPNFQGLKSLNSGIVIDADKPSNR